MRAVSLFSGVGGMDLGLERAGIETVLQVENDRWCQQVLARHWPDVERVDDVRSVVSGCVQPDDWECRLSAEIATRWGQPRDGIDIVHGGFPCQDLSVAGKRAGFGGERSSLWFEFHRIVRELRPRWVLIENVPGLLSSNGGADFAVVLNGLDELGFDAAWAVLDARHFGVPQRRRRVFVVAGPRGRGPEQVLSLCESCGGNPETGRAAGEDLAYTLAAGARGTGDGHGNAWNSTYIANTLKANTGHAGGADLDTYVAFAVTASAGHHGYSTPRGDGSDNLVEAAGVRRLTPRECERLMGWPDDWTRWAADGSEIADSHRYRMAGNGVVSPVAEWIGHRLVAVNEEVEA